MKWIGSEDLAYLENKYHRTDEPFDAFQRMNYHGYEYDPETGLSDGEMDAGLAALSEKLAGQPHPVAKAKLFAFVLDNTRIDVNEHDFFVGIYSCSRPLDEYTVRPWYREVRDAFPAAAARLNEAAKAGETYGGLDFDHTVPDWDRMMKLGFTGLLAYARASHERLAASGALTEKKEAFFRGVEMEYEALIRLIDRLQKRAAACRFDKAPAIAEALARLRDGAPQTTYDAMMMIYLYFMASENVDHYQVRSLGYGLDATLYPFYQADLARGVSREEIGRLLAYFLMQWSAIGNYWGQPMYLAGTRPDGTTRVNELSYLILDVYNDLGIYNPKIQIKVGGATPKAFLMKALTMIRDGVSSIVFCSERHIVQALMARGATYEQAMDGQISGCYEYAVKARHIGVGGLYPNPLKPVSLVFDNGVDRFSGLKIGVETGDVTAFTSFEQFYRAYLKQLAFQITSDLDALDQLATRVAEVNPSLLFSGTIAACMDSMTDALDCGIDNGMGLTLGGVGTAADALMAVKELVFDRKLATMKELKDALDANWEGHEKLRARALTLKHKYGNGDPEADQYAAAIMRFIATDLTAGRVNSHGGHVGVEAHSARAFIIHGEKTLATPDGRRLGDETSKNASPTPGMDRCGVTSLIRSATTLPVDLCTTGFCLDVMLHPTTVQGAEGLDVFLSVLETYLDRGGASIHFNIFSADQLRDAQAHPEKYRSLQVRVCGWNVLWNNMCREEQDAYILRAEHIQQ